MKNNFLKVLAIIITIIVVSFICICVSNNTAEPKVYSDEIKIYSIKEINISDSNANLIFLDDLDGTEQKELIVKKGDSYTFEKIDKYSIKVLELTDGYITISIKGLAPTKLNGGFSLKTKYEKITIEKNTGVCLNIQATDLYDGSVYFFYAND